MATHTVAAGDRGIGPVTLVATQVDSIVFTDNVTLVELYNEGPGDVYYTTNGADPVVPTAGQSTNATRVPSGMADQSALPGSSDSIKVRSSGTPVVTVQRSNRDQHSG